MRSWPSDEGWGPVYEDRYLFHFPFPNLSVVPFFGSYGQKYCQIKFIISEDLGKNIRPTGKEKEAADCRDACLNDTVKYKNKTNSS